MMTWASRQQHDELRDAKKEIERLNEGWSEANSTILDRDITIVGLKAEIGHLEWVIPALIAHLRALGCRCEQPLLGYSPGFGPRCRLCNVDCEPWNKNEDAARRATKAPAHADQEGVK